MTLVLLVPAWLLLMVLLAGLCRSAQSGDADMRYAQALRLRTQTAPGFAAEDNVRLGSAGSHVESAHDQTHMVAAA